ncbi:AraC family transcriptional regulator [Paenibacillus ginsengarvi]|uniref:AraC family transcriptional regulator n=1 Tax=Paenibacillus ginsengarvi TaxID=400777 RepID=A0A3B0B1M5_9BACL|nr:AraC family transcriptional regulator [Paenibacillus ginsengarvi]
MANLSVFKRKTAVLRGLPITEGKHCGFGDYCNFYRLFKNKLGMSPKQYFAVALKED